MLAVSGVEEVGSILEADFMLFTLPNSKCLQNPSV
jgi:hypothetical protein